jgi:hypothetical protein
VEISFPAGKRLAYEISAREVETYQQVWMIEGVMELTVGQDLWLLKTGAGLAMRVDRPLVYRNPTCKAARYLVALAHFFGADVVGRMR